MLDRLGPLSQEHRTMTAVRSGPLVLGFMGGKGGVGTSVIAAAVGHIAADKAIVIDLDSHGGGIELLLAAEGQPGQRWADLVHASGTLDPHALRPAISAQGAAFISHGRTPVRLDPAAVCAVITAAKQRFELVVLDLPRGLVDSEILACIDHLLIVATGDVRSCASTAATIGDLRKQHSKISAILRTSQDAVRIAEFLGVPLAAEVLWEPKLDHDIDNGIAPGSRKRGQIAVGVGQLLQWLTTQPVLPRRRAAS